MNGIDSRWQGFLRSLILLTILIMPAFFLADIVLSQEGGYIDLVREIELDEIGVESAVGLAYSPQADVLILLHGQPVNDNPAVSMINRIEQPVGSSTLSDPLADPVDAAFNPQTNSLYTLEPAGEELAQIPAEPDGKLPSSASSTGRTDLRGLGVQNAQGMVFDPTNGRLFFLNPSGRQLIAITPDEQGSYDVGPAQSEGRISRIDLKTLAGKHLRGLAFDPDKQRFYTVDPDSKIIYEFDETLENVKALDLSPFLVQDPQGLIVAPSGDPTDDPQNQSLYLADPGRNFVVELTLTAPAAIAALPPLRTDLALVQTIRSSTWNPPSPDPAGVDYIPSINKMIVADSEVDEMTIYAGRNIFLASPGGSLSATCDTTAFSKEPTGAAVNPANGFVYFSDDGKDRIFEINPGSDGAYCTGDDSRRSINTLSYGSTDAEGVAFGDGHLFIADGLAAEVYRIAPGSNGIFDGGPGTGDDQVTHFDTLGLALQDPEGIGYNPQRQTLFIVSRRDQILVETSLSGNPLNLFDLSFFNPDKPAGVGAAPGSQNPAIYNIFIADRGIDNNDDPNENDGRVYEVRLGSPTDPTPTPPPTEPVRAYLSLANSGAYTVGNVTGVRDEDVLSFDGTNFAMVFDGSDVGVGGVDVDAFYAVDGNTFLFSFGNAITISGPGAVDDWDIVQFDATSVGTVTSGAFSLYFDGNDVELNASAEDIDAFDLLPDGRLLFSTTGNSTISGISVRDEDILAFTPTSLGTNTAGTWEMYFDGSDVGLATDNGEDINGTSVNGAGDVYLSTLGAFSVTGVSGTNADIFRCTPSSLGDTTACTFSSTLFFQGSTWGITANNLDAFDVP